MTKRIDLIEERKKILKVAQEVLSASAFIRLSKALKRIA